MKINNIILFFVILFAYSISANNNSTYKEDIVKDVIDDFNEFMKSFNIKAEPSLRFYDCVNIAIALYIATITDYKTDIESNKRLYWVAFGWLFFSDYLKNKYTQQKTAVTRSILLTGSIMFFRHNQNSFKNWFMR